MSSVLQHVNASLRRIYDASATRLEFDIGSITALWSACSEAEQRLEDLALLCGRVSTVSCFCVNDLTSPRVKGMTIPPGQYSKALNSTPELLSHIDNHLEKNFETNSPLATTAMSAFILTSVATDYFERICYSVGYHNKGRLSGTSRPTERLNTGLFDDDAQEDDEAEDSYALSLESEPFPSFFTSHFSRAMRRARRSLTLLQAACPEHPILAHAVTRRKLRWFWSEQEIEAAWLGSASRSHSAQPSASSVAGTSSTKLDDVSYKPEIRAFQLFDLEPGVHLSQATTSAASTPTNTFQTFLADFPAHLPSLTPTLPTLRDLILEPLATHIASLSAALKDAFLSPSSGYLDFRRHIVLLRSYLLLTSHAFKTRLQAALFCDAPEATPSAGMAARSMARRNSRSSSRRRRADTPTAADAWIIGLSPALTEGSNWPPGGSDLSYYLRTVIIDALEADYRSEARHDDGSDGGARKEDQLLEEAEWRLGFAIRDLAGGSRARWLNPRSTLLVLYL